MIEGELTFQLRDDVFTREAGELAFAPRGAAHTYANHSDAPARALIICTPASFERYFARRAADRDGIDPPGLGAAGHSRRGAARPTDRTAAAVRMRWACAIAHKLLTPVARLGVLDPARRWTCRTVV